MVTVSELNEMQRVDETTEFLVDKLMALELPSSVSKRTLASYLARQLMYDDRLK